MKNQMNNHIPEWTKTRWETKQKDKKFQVFMALHKFLLRDYLESMMYQISSFVFTHQYRKKS